MKIITTLLLIFFWTNIIAQNPIKSHYKTFGKGKPILLINGGPGMNSEGFTHIAEQIAKFGYQTIIYDQRGTGKTILDKIDSTTITMELMAQDIENLREELGIKKWVVFGQSFGGLMATYYFAKYPQSIEKIIFSASGGVNLDFMKYIGKRINQNLTTVQKDSIDFYQNKIDNGENTPENVQKRADILANAYVFDKKHASVIAKRLAQANFKINRLVMNDLQKIKFNYKNAFKENNTPVLVLQGENDIVSIETAKEIQNSFGNAKLVLFKKCGHYGWLDAKKQYLKTIKDFLNKI